MANHGADTSQSSASHRGSRTRMSAMQRREQLIDVGRRVFADKGFDGTSIEEIAALAKVSKPVVYEHFGDKDGLYAVVIDREMTVLMGMLTEALTSTHPRVLLAQAATALFDYIDANTAGFRVLLRPNPRGATFGTVIRDVAAHLENQLVPVCKRYGYPTKMAPMYAHMLVGMVGLTGEWWAEVRKPGKDEVIAQVVNMAWNGVSRLDPKPQPVRFAEPDPGEAAHGDGPHNSRLGYQASESAEQVTQRGEQVTQRGEQVTQPSGQVTQPGQSAHDARTESAAATSDPQPSGT